MNGYEGVVIFKDGLSEKDLEKEYSNAEEVIKKHEGDIEKSEKWGRKTLTYTIDKLRGGFFLFLNFKAPPGAIVSMRELFKHNTNILRVMITRREE